MIFFLDRRRIATSSASTTIASSVPPAKKPKLPVGVLPGTNPFLPPNAVPEPMKSWEQNAIEIDSIDLVPTVVEAKDNEEYEKVVSTLLLSWKTSILLKLIFI